MGDFAEFFNTMSGWSKTSVIVSTGFLLIGIYGLLWSWGARQKHRRVLGAARFRKCARYTRAAGTWSPRILGMALTKWSCLLAGSYLLYRQWQDLTSPFALLIGALLVMVGLLQFGRQIQPGTILILGSGEQSINLHEKIIGNGGAFPIRSVSLLETGDIAVDMRIAGDCFRISEDGNWRSIVFGFAQCAAVVVMDCRTLTKLVQEECGHVLTEHPHKTIFVVDSIEDEASDPVCLTKADAGPAKTLTIDDVEACPRFLSFLLNFLEACPSSDNPIWEFYLPFLEQEQKRRIKSSVRSIPLRPQMAFGWALAMLPDAQNPEAIETYQLASRTEARATR